MNKGLLAILVAFALGLPLVSSAQGGAKSLPRIGYLTERAGPTVFDESFLQGLRDLGYVDGQNIAIDYRWGDGNADRVPGMVAELIGRKVDLIVTAGTPAALAAKRATSTVPILMLSVPDAVALGLVTNIARPGGNVTGQSTFASELAGKRLQIIKEAIPGITRVGLLFNAANPANLVQFKESESAARQLGLEVRAMEARFPNNLEEVFAHVANWGARGVVILSDGATIRHRSEIANFATKYGIATMFANRDYLEGGGLMSYGPDIRGVYRRGATYADKILRGAKPGDLPFEQPVKLEFAVNLKAAKALGLTIPDSVLVRADELIK